MSAAFDEIAHARPKIRRDVLFAKMPDGVLFHNSKEGFQIRSATGYEFASLMVPHLNGDNRVSDICAGLGVARRTMVTELVTALFSHGFARDAKPPACGAVLSPETRAAFSEQVQYIDHYVDDAEERFQRFRDTRVAIIGDDVIARWCALSLVRNGVARIGVQHALDTPDTLFADVTAEAEALAGRGCPAVIDRLPSATGLLNWQGLHGYDVVVVSASAGPRQILHLLSAGVPGNAALLSASVVGNHVMVGPLTAAGATSCWACAALRTAANDESGAAARLWSQAALPDDGTLHAVRPPRPLAAMVGNLLGYEVFRLRTGALPAETVGRVVMQELDSMDVSTERVLPHPHCPFCAGRDDASHGETAGAAPIDIRDDGDLDGPAHPRPGEGAPATAEEEARRLRELNGKMVLVGSRTGVFKDFTDDELTQSPLKVTRLRIGLGPDTRRTVTGCDVHTVLGARLRALYGAAAVYTDRLVPLRGVLAGAALASAGEMLQQVDPRALVTAAGLHAPDAPVSAWVAATSLLTGRQVLVPAGAVQPFGRYNDDRTWMPAAAGTGTGATLAQALRGGLLSVLSYEAVCEAIRGRRTVTQVALETVERQGDVSPELTFLVRSLRTLGLTAELLQLGEAERTSAYVVLARAGGPRCVGGSGRTLHAVGAGTTLAAAAVRALCDLLGRIQLAGDPAAAQGAGWGDDNAGEPFDTFDATALVVSAERALEPTAPVPWATVLDRLRARGGDVLGVPRLSNDLLRGGISVARVLLATAR